MFAMMVMIMMLCMGAVAVIQACSGAHFGIVKIGTADLRERISPSIVQRLRTEKIF